MNYYMRGGQVEAGDAAVIGFAAVALADRGREPRGLDPIGKRRTGSRVSLSPSNSVFVGAPEI